MAEARAAIDRSGPGYGDPPLLRQGGHRDRRSTEHEDSHQDREGEENLKKYTAKFRKTPPPQAGQAGVARRHRVRNRPEFRCPCTADGGTVAEYRSVLRRTLTCSREGYRSAEDLASRCSSATVVSRHAAGGTAGGGADDRFLVFAAADCGAAR